MCILFIYNGNEDVESDYRLIIATNRDEFYERPAQIMAPWEGQADVLAGKDVRGGGTWLALSAVTKKIGVLLNHPVAPTKTAVKSRGKIAIDYVKGGLSIREFVDSMREYFQECPGFIFVSLDFGNDYTKVHSYTKNTDNLEEHSEKYLGFGNSAPATPFKKVQAGRQRMQGVCQRLNKIHMKEQLVNELIELLRWEEKHLPDQVIEGQHPDNYKHLSSVYVHVPNIYGTRTHTLVLITKDGGMDVIEVTLRAPIDSQKPNWEKTKFRFKL
ncbi:transport and Golgi organization protein 2 [Plodia interpunctella]|uniref:transport and Golgi organization protein 2 n=1 Tax=Plodia interpunctella TaxID=58824 RepID=UPI002368EDD1|nr:transport and Golgi organization protein 2 [Plodia interpunctella]XP_053617790.1 transport and Golgi organization protein 2 [Plodia interpunctella]XP_053617791.1 transport and Golgi organization protein 2 [Plodia interpunctella]XP_053617792.1 transport and Golgi organization protein 2 [Plodia interpunctella]